MAVFPEMQSTSGKDHERPGDPPQVKPAVPQRRETVLSRPHVNDDGMIAFFDQDDRERILLFEIAMQAMEGRETLDVYGRMGRTLPLTRWVDIDSLGDPSARSGAREALDWLLSRGERNDNGLLWSHDFDLEHPSQGVLAAPWPSAFSQAFILLALITWHRFHPKLVIREILSAAAQPFFQSQGGFVTVEPSQGIWFQEYPFARPTYVLNAHLISLAALARLYRTYPDAVIRECIDAGRRAVGSKLSLFDRGIWTRYDLESQDSLIFQAQASHEREEPEINSIEIALAGGRVLGNWLAEGFEESNSYSGIFQGSDWHLTHDGSQSVRVSVADDQYLHFPKLGATWQELQRGVQVKIFGTGLKGLRVRPRDMRLESLTFLRKLSRVPASGDTMAEYICPFEFIGPPLPMHYHAFHAFAAQDAAQQLGDRDLTRFADRCREQLIAAGQSADTEITRLHQARRAIVASVKGDSTPSDHPAVANIARLRQRVQELEAARDLAESRFRLLELSKQSLEWSHGSLETRCAVFQREAEALHVRVGELHGQLALRAGFKGILRELYSATKNLVAGTPVAESAPRFPDAWKPLGQVEPPAGANRRVLVLSHMFPHPEQPSSGPFVHEQVKALRQNGIDARVLVGRPFWMTNRNPLSLWRSNRAFGRFFERCLRWWEYDGVPVCYLPYRIFGPWFTQGWSYRSSMLRALKHIRREFEFELVHAHTGFLDGGAGRAIAAQCGVPYFVTEHTGPFSILMKNSIIRRATLRALGGAHRVIVVSRAQGSSITEHAAPELAEKIVVLPNVVDTNVFSPTNDRAADRAAGRILFVGYFVPIKQLPLLLDTFAIVRTRMPHATLQLVGGGENKEQEAELFREIQKRGLSGPVMIRGHQSRDQVARIMREECDVLVLCSKSETFGCVLAEALSSGRPVVATRCGGPEDIIANNELGRLCENGNPQALADAVVQVLQNADSFDPARLRRHAETHFSFSAVSRNISTLYESALSRGARGALQTAAAT